MTTTGTAIPDVEHQAELDDPSTASALLPEARQRAARRRLVVGLCSLLCLALIAAVLAAVGGPPFGGATAGSGRGAPGPGAIAHGAGSATREGVAVLTADQLAALSPTVQMLSLTRGVAVNWLGTGCNGHDTNPSCSVLATTTDGGRTWVDASHRWSPLVKSRWAASTSFHFTSRSDGWLLTGPPATWNGGSATSWLMRTTDGGRTLSAVPTPGHVIDLSVGGGVVWVLVAEHCHATSWSKAFSSCTERLESTPATGGVSWRSAAIPGAPSVLWPIPIANYQPGGIFAGRVSSRAGGLFLGGSMVAATTDTGMRWRVSSLGGACEESPTMDALQLVMVTASRWIAFCAGPYPQSVNKEYVSSDAGVTWHLVRSCLPVRSPTCGPIPSASEGSAVASGNGRLVWAEGGSASQTVVFVSKDAGLTWHRALVLDEGELDGPQVVALGSQSAYVSDGLAPIAVSADGLHWTTVGHP